jgi:hypothetical protein
MQPILARWLVVTIVLVVAGPLAALLAGVQPPAFEPGAAGAGAPAALLGWSVVSSAVVAAVLVGLAARSTALGWTRAAGLFIIAFGIGHFAGLIEAYFFHVLDGPTTLRLLAMSAITSAAGCGVAAWLATTATGAGDHHVPWQPTPGKLAIVSVLYVVAYFTAGTLVYPFIEAFYATRSLPPTLTVAAMQLFVRGPLFAFILAWIAGSTRGSRAVRALWAGAALSLLGGVAPLVMPNPYFPDAVRWAHFIETSTSNLVFGAIAGWMLVRSTATPRLKRGYGETAATASQP